MVPGRVYNYSCNYIIFCRLSLGGILMTNHLFQRRYHNDSRPDEMRKALNLAYVVEFSGNMKSSVYYL